jgi:dTDP-4-amino-4,6-dideoxy-D-galactose acyltransferase
MNQVADFKTLEWDSSFLGISTGMITRQDLSEDEIDHLLVKMKTDGYNLVYFPSAHKMETDLVDRFNGILADEKITFSKSIGKISLQETDAHIISYDHKHVSPALLELAWESGIYSRFNIDPHFKKNAFRELYKIWIERSVSREIAKDVLVYMDGSVIGGMITLGEKNNRGDIGLVAVAESSRGKGIGKKLMMAAENAFRDMGYDEVQVVTQGINKPAVSLYQSCGYTKDEHLFYYHFWL